MDTRAALKNGSLLSFSNHEGGKITYTVRKEIGRGGSCIVYDASYRTNLGDEKIVHIKECFPFGLRIRRMEDGSLISDSKDQELFENEIKVMRCSFLRNNRLFANEALTNSISNTVDYYEYGGTCYVVSVYMSGETLSKHKCVNLRECMAILRSTAKALLQIHNAGFLYLDVKPENILVLHGTTELVQLFDFDSIAELSEIRNGSGAGNKISYTRGFAPLELQLGRMSGIGFHTDVFGIGAILFYLMFGHTPTAFDCDEYATYNYDSSSLTAGVYSDNLYRELTEFFHRTLSRFIPSRYSNMDSVLNQMERIIRDADETQEYILSTTIREPKRCFDREKELNQLKEMLSGDASVVSLCGMGGIGKTTLVKRYLCKYKNDYDTVIYVNRNYSAVDLITNDDVVRINTVSKAREESVDDYYKRKTRKIRDLSASGKTLLVLDNVEIRSIDEVDDILLLPWKVLLISREPFPGEPFTQLKLKRLDDEGLLELFESILCVELSETDRYFINRIIDCVDGHTLILELIAEQIKNSYLTPEQALKMIQQAGFVHFSEENVSYRKDGRTFYGSVNAVLGRLFEIDRFAEETMILVRELSLFGNAGTELELFRELTELRSMQSLQPLISCGWLRIENRKINMHPITREYIALQPFGENEEHCIERMMERLYHMIRKEGSGKSDVGPGMYDINRQNPADYRRFNRLLETASQILEAYRIPGTIRHRLLYHLAMDAPVDREQEMINRCKEIFRRPELLDSGSVLRLYSEAAFLYGRMNKSDTAHEILREMWAFLEKNPSSYYRSVFYQTAAILIYNEDESDEAYFECLRLFDHAIPAARTSSHPGRYKQLAACLVGKATTLMTGKIKIDGEKCEALLNEAGELIVRYADEYDYERYQYYCISSLFHARVTGNRESALRYLHMADHIADVARDSDLSWIDHIWEESAPLYNELGMYDTAIDLIIGAIAKCDEYDTMPYKRAKYNLYEMMSVIYRCMGDHTGEMVIKKKMDVIRADMEDFALKSTETE